LAYTLLLMEVKQEEVTMTHHPYEPHLWNSLDTLSSELDISCPDIRARKNSSQTTGRRAGIPGLSSVLTLARTGLDRLKTHPPRIPSFDRLPEKLYCSVC
jgi:hypothetical protein